MGVIELRKVIHIILSGKLKDQDELEYVPLDKTPTWIKKTD